MYKILTIDHPWPYPYPYRRHLIAYVRSGEYTRKQVDCYISEHAMRGIRGYLREELAETGKCSFNTRL